VSTVQEEPEMHMIAADAAFQLAADRRQHLLRERSAFPTRSRRLRRRPVVDHLLPGSPPDAA
jgi:hypothetical protein